MTPEELLQDSPFEITQPEKTPRFVGAMKESLTWHYKNSPEFKKYCDNRSFNPENDFVIEDIPYLPVTIFKSVDLCSVPENEITKTLYSSSTSGQPSKIFIDKVTTERQTKALRQIMTSYLGTKRRHFIVFDAEKTVKAVDGELTSRGTAIRGMLPLAKKITFLLDENLKLTKDRLAEVVEQVNDDETICFFGFTWMIYNTFLENKDNPEISELFAQFKSQDKLALHIGGWKKLKDIAVEKEDFNKQVEGFLNLKPGTVTDFYGMTEQLGTVHPDCPKGYKHLPLYSELLIRDPATLQPLEHGEIGFIQLLSPLPHSYPGISVLSDDLGRVVGVDDCECGRKGTYFVFEKRSETAEVKGCGDTVDTT